MNETIPLYGMLDIWMAVGLRSNDFEGYYEATGYADTWSNLLWAVRYRTLELPPGCRRFPLPAYGSDWQTA